MIYKYLGDRIDIPAPDVGSNAQVMSWMLDEYEKIKGQSRAWRDYRQACFVERLFRKNSGNRCGCS